jgi:D-glycero-D-manno-heptose 1,7-bisphosphate phosphatase
VTWHQHADLTTYQAIFLDRDGVLNRERADYVKCWEEFELLPGVLPALARLAALQRPVLVITNQSGIGRGRMSRAAVDEIHRRLQVLVQGQGGRIDAFYVCPHRPDEGCGCRKPQPGLLLQAAQDFGLDLGQCLMIGDALTDYQAAVAAGCACCLVMTGRQGAQLQTLLPAQGGPPLVADLATAVALYGVSTL